MRRCRDCARAIRGECAIGGGIPGNNMGGACFLPKQKERPQMTPMCFTCRYLHAGNCHRYPPQTFTPHPTDKWGVRQTEYRIIWPDVDEQHDWCGEHQPVTPEEEK